MRFRFEIEDAKRIAKTDVRFTDFYNKPLIGSCEMWSLSPRQTEAWIIAHPGVISRRITKSKEVQIYKLKYKNHETKETIEVTVSPMANKVLDLKIENIDMPSIEDEKKKRIIIRNAETRKELNLSARKIKDISEIKALNKLSSIIELDLSVNNITEIHGLESLTTLEILNLNSNEIKDISRLEALTNLKQLKLSNNKITEIKGLDSLASLEVLWLDENKITEMKGLKNLKNLTEILLQYNLITRIEGLDGLTLKVLNLECNQIKSIEGLDKLPDVEALYLDNNKISNFQDFKILTDFSSLSKLTLKGNSLFRYYTSHDKLLEDNRFLIKLASDLNESVRREIWALIKAVPFKDHTCTVVAAYPICLECGSSSVVFDGHVTHCEKCGWKGDNPI